MRKVMKGLFLLTAVVLAALITAPVYAADDMAVVYAEVPDGWDAPHLWAWGPDGNAFPEWPGGVMQADPGNPGWYFVHVPASVSYVIINANEAAFKR